MKISKEMIRNFLATKTLAVAGVSRDPKKFGYTVLKDLEKKGFNVLPVNPETDLIDETKCYRSLSALPAGVDRLVIVTPKTGTLQVMKEALDKGIRDIWIQQHSETHEAIDFATENKLNLIYGKCILMFSEPVEGFHKFHRNILRFFGGVPK
jgi:predicted CoA-binding protein